MSKLSELLTIDRSILKDFLEKECIISNIE